MNTREVQDALRAIGWPITVDGSFGEQTKQAVTDFQRGWAFYSLLIDGYAGPQTQNALRDCLNNGGKCASYFTFAEFKSNGNGWIKVHRVLAFSLDRYRERYGPTKIVSGYRDPLYNRRLGAVPNSQHVYGNAADIAAVASVASIKTLRLFSGIGYDRSTGRVRHVDVRHMGPNTTNGSPSNPTVWAYG